MVERIIELAKDYCNANNLFLQQCNGTSIEETIDYINFYKYQIIQWKQNDLRSFLDSLDFEDLKFVKTLMYIGRDELTEEEISAEQLYYEVFKSVNWEIKEFEVDTIIEKSPLHIYLWNGIEIIKALQFKLSDAKH